MVDSLIPRNPVVKIEKSLVNIPLKKPDINSRRPISSQRETKQAWSKMDLLYGQKKLFSGETIDVQKL